MGGADAGALTGALGVLVQPSVALRPGTGLTSAVWVAAPPRGVTVAQAQTDMDAAAGQIRQAYSEFAAEKLKFALVPLHGDAVRDVRPALTALFAGAGFVLLICCVNVANLLLARAGGRTKEIAVRSAIGATQGRRHRLWRPGR